AETYPLRRFGTSTDVANLVLFLASEDASWITGQNILVDGGATIQLAEAVVHPGYRQYLDKTAELRQSQGVIEQ
ncbi:MAG: SDR family oxidoreductase, partial [Propionicimonas sp.]|nr:SDR family oxidoreductase [Propionicimonas sp.]